MSIDADGSPRAYHPRGSPPGLDDLANAGTPGHFFGIVTDVTGRPVVQRRGDPAPGFFVSTTALEDTSHPRTSPRRYVNSSTIPYIVLPTRALEPTGARLGDLASVWNRRTEKLSHAIIADVGPRGRIGEGSIALARRLGINASAISGGQSGDVVFIVFPGSGNRRPRPFADIKAKAAPLFAAWGGIERVREI
jgi:Fungal chitosanase of glycosyl hydrolase group 75